MVAFFDPSDRKRSSPRVPVEAFCSEIHDEELRHAIVVDVSPDGLRLQRPVGGPRTRTIQLEFEIPGVDEVVWARGEIRFDEVWRVPPVTGTGGIAGLSGIIRTSGVAIVAGAGRQRRLLREYVMDTWRTLVGRPCEEELQLASCYLRG